MQAIKWKNSWVARRSYALGIWLFYFLSLDLDAYNDAGADLLSELEFLLIEGNFPVRFLFVPRCLEAAVAA